METATVYIALSLSMLSCVVFIWGLSTRTVWWKKFCGVGWFLMAIPIGGLLLTIYMFLQQTGIWPFDSEHFGRLAICSYIILVVTGFTAILYKKNNAIEVAVVREEIIKESTVEGTFTATIKDSVEEG